MTAIDNVTRKFSDETVATMKAMIARGDRLIDVAYWFQASPSVVHGVKSGALRWTKRIAKSTGPLPPQGPYIVVSHSAYSAATAKAIAHDFVVRELEAIITRLKQEHVDGRPNLSAPVQTLHS